MSEVFLTGGSGYIGRATIAALVRRGHRVAALARSEDAARTVTAAGAEPVAGELTDPAGLERAARGADAVIHLAQAASGEEDLAAAAAMLRGVADGPYVHTGGTWVYGDTDGVVGEDAPWAPPPVVAWREPVEKAVLGSDGRPVIVRPGLLHGGENRLIEQFFAAPARATGAVPVIGDGSNHWALVHVDDLAELYVAALDAAAGSVYVGVSGTNPTAAEVAAAVGASLGLDATRSLTLAEAREQMGPVADAFALDQQLTPARAVRELGWRIVHTDPVAELRAG